ncbi:SDR family oxidoreductase, partial [Pseudomonas sp. Marseille-Q0931]|uniref:SDR family oxidoreductase n=1 Tax=Pseudomonas sp. Marseille-Q0931 TaxID=2697507 RepID=UPI0023B8A64C
ASSAAPPTPDALSNNAPHGSHFRPPTKTHRINSHDNYPDAAGTPEDVASAVMFFASREAGYITGQSLIIDGGQVLPESLQAID